MNEQEPYALRPIGVVRSELTDRAVAPRQGNEGAPEAWIEVHADYVDALSGLLEGDQVIVLTWFHLADRRVLQCHPRDDPRTPLTGVFATRSPDRPNPIGLHRVSVLELRATALKVAPLEAVDETPVIDLKPVLATSSDG